MPQAQTVLLDYGCTNWRRSSQLAANAYGNGTKLWTKEDLRDIEQQLKDSVNREVFTVRSIFGDVLAIKNPIYGEERPIWKPYVKFKEYWRLVKDQPKDSESTYCCSYLVEWTNTTARHYRDLIADPLAVFERMRLWWISSASCIQLQNELKSIIAGVEVKKVICFGLGDICRQPPEWVKRDMDLNDSGPESKFVHGSMVQHAIALTMAEICREGGDNKVQLLAQDPDYTAKAQDILQKYGFSIIGHFGAEGFAEIDDQTLVFSVFVEAPLKQIIADTARPAVLITTKPDTFNDSEKPWMDAESPRTKELWRGYRRQGFPNSHEDEEVMGKLSNLDILTRKHIVNE